MHPGLESNMEAQSEILKPKRKSRKKALYKKIAAQMDFYFGDSNLRKDGFLKKEIDASTDGYIPLSLFLKFNKLRKLEVTTEDIGKAVTIFSKILTLNEIRDKVKRTTPISLEQNVDDRIVYLEGITQNANHDSITTLMSEYGKVNYVSLPRYPSTNDLKGFAFVEFDSPEAVSNCLKAIGTKKFESVNPFPKDGSKDIQRAQKLVMKSGAVGEPLQSKKRNKERNSTRTEVDEPASKKPKARSSLESTPCVKEETASSDQSNQSQKPSKKRKRKLSHHTSQDDAKEPKVETTNSDGPTTVKPSNKEKHNSSVPKKSKASQSIQEAETNGKKKETGNPSSQLKAISKFDWLTLRNQYLQMQKSNMAALKQKLREQKAKEASDLAKASQSKDAVEMLELVPNLIVEIKSDGEMVREDIKKSLPHGIGVSYIDVPVGSTSGFIRCKTCEDAERLLKENYRTEYKLTLLQGENEKAYWDRLNQQRIERRNSNVKKSKRATNKKGTQKVLEQQDRLNKKGKKNSHIVFD